jgi:acetyl esterase
VTLHPQAAVWLATVGDSGPGTLAAARARLDAAAATECGAGPDLALVDELRLGGVACRRYHPRPRTLLPVVVYLHGGGWTTGSLETVDAVCRWLAVRSGCAVVSVDYRLAPEHPWPAAVEDVDAVLDQIGRDGASVGLDGAWVALAGDSSGGTLAAVAARRARDAGRPVTYQVLVCPAIDPAMATPSYAEHAVGVGLDAAEMAQVWANYVPDLAHRQDPDVAPGNATDLAGLPAALVVTAGYDVLRDEGEAYADRLALAGVPTTLVRYPGMVHGFFRRLALFDAARVAADQVAAALRIGLHVAAGSAQRPCA